MNVYASLFIAAACAISWPFARRIVATSFERVIVTSAITLLSLVAAIGLCLLVCGRLRLVFILPAAITFVFCFIYFLCKRAREQIAEPVKPVHGRIVAMIALAVIVAGFGRQFQYASFWGDVGVYSFEAQHILNGGGNTFDFRTSRLNIPPEPPAPFVPNGINRSTAGGHQFHALPTWPAVMAMLGPSFDVAAILSLLYGLTIGLFYLLVREIFDDGLPALTATIVLALLPLAWFLSLYPTAEMLVLAVALATTYLYLKTRGHPIVLGLGVFCFGAVHISVFLASPIIGVLIFLAGINSERELRVRLASGALLAAIGGLLATAFAIHVSQKYALDIAQSMFGSRRELIWLAAISPLIGGVPFIIDFLGTWPLVILRNGYGYWLKNASVASIGLLAVITCIVVFQCYLMGWTSYYVPLETSQFSSASARVAYMNKGPISVAHHSMLSLTAASGVLGMMAFFALPFTWIKQKSLPFTEHLVWVAGAYVVMLYGVLHIDVTNNYYASRYLLPIAVPVLLILSVPWLQKWRGGVIYAVSFIGFASLYYVSALLGQGFFQGDKIFLSEIMKETDATSSLYVEGSTWLDYMLAPVFTDTVEVHSKISAGPGSADMSPATLITDVANVAGGFKACYSYEQRRIPWQISYPLYPQIEEHKVCVVRPSSVGVMNLRSNQWLIDGAFKFIAVGPASGKSVEIEFDSLGWWASKRPFVADWQAIKPSLQVCGSKFDLSVLTPRRVAFRGRMKAPFCHALLSTSTFTPREIGDGQDARSLGLDIYAVRISEIR